MKPQFFVLTLFLGFILTIHLVMNGRVGAAMDNARVANAVFWSIGALTAIIVGFTGWESGVLGQLRNVNPLLLTAGIMGALLVFSIAWLEPRVGAGPLFLLLLAGQVICSLLISHFGWLGSPVQPLSWFKVVGALLMIGGAALATMSVSSSSQLETASTVQTTSKINAE